MKLLVIVLCILSERYLIHSASYYRFYWFNTYFNLVKNKLPMTGLLANPYVLLTIVILPIILLVALIILLMANWLLGFVGLLINLLIFYYCLGPENSFYPVSNIEDIPGEERAAENYFAKVNNQLFAVIFWFIVAGPLAILLYRLLYLCKMHEATESAADVVTSVLDWVTVRITLMLYLLVGNFQQGYRYYVERFFAPPKENDELLGKGGVLATRTQVNELVSLPYAQTLVEHALVVYLVFIALFTLVAWL